VDHGSHLGFWWHLSRSQSLIQFPSEFKPQAHHTSSIQSLVCLGATTRYPHRIVLVGPVILHCTTMWFSRLSMITVNDMHIPVGALSQYASSSSSTAITDPITQQYLDDASSVSLGSILQFTQYLSGRHLIPSNLPPRRVRWLHCRFG